MSKQHKIRWTSTDNKEIARVVRNFNAKINRITKKNPQMKNVLPKFWDSETESFTDKLTVRQVKELINTRQDLKRELNSLKRFSKKGAEQVVVISNNENNIQLTKWQKTEMNRRVANINRRRANRLELISETEVESRGQKLGYTRGQLGMGKIQELSLSPMNAFTRSMRHDDIKWKWRSILAQSQSDYFTRSDFRLRENFINTLLENYNMDDIKDVVEAIENMDIGDFLKEYYKDPEAFEWAYPDDPERYHGYVNALKTIWNPSR